MATEVCDEEQPWGPPAGIYGWSKQTQEQVAQEVADTRGVPLTIVRPANVYGPGSKSWVDDVIVQLGKKLPALIDGGWQNAGLVYVDNLVAGLSLAATVPASAGRAYNLCDELPVSWERYFSDLALLAGVPPPKSVPRTLANAGAILCEAPWRLLPLAGRPPLTHEALNLVGSNTRVPSDRAREELGYAPTVPYDQGLEAIANYLTQQNCP